MFVFNEYVRSFDPDKYDMIGGKLVERTDYKKRMLEAALKGLESSKEYLNSQLNIFADKMLTVEEKIKEKEAQLKEL
jgi:hypothetical protein